MEQIYILSAVLNRCIKSYYPPQIHSDLSSEPYTKRVIGRGCKDMASSITIMWTQCTEPMEMLTPNHFVPLLSKAIFLFSRTPLKALSFESVHDLDSSKDIYSGDFTEIRYHNSNGNSEIYDNVDNEIPVSSFDSKFSGELKGGFMGIDAVLNCLSSTDGEGLSAVPSGEKNNVYFLLKNDRNLENRS
ncbi:hypothetical protein ACF0H5_005165 [Mactra antiquata]